MIEPISYFAVFDTINLYLGENFWLTILFSNLVSFINLCTSILGGGSFVMVLRLSKSFRAIGKNLMIVSLEFKAHISSK